MNEFSSRKRSQIADFSEHRTIAKRIAENIFNEIFHKNKDFSAIPPGLTGRSPAGGPRAQVRVGATYRHPQISKASPSALDLHICRRG
jgi:hypothetical protein